MEKMTIAKENFIPENKAKNLPVKVLGLLGRLQSLPGRVVKIVKNLPYINLRKLGSLRIPNHLKNLRYLKSPRSRKALLFFAGILIILAPLTFILLKSPPQVEASWWDDNWVFRKRVTVSNSGSEQTDFQVGITLDTATLITNGKMQSDCGDIRVPDPGGDNLDYWVQNCNDLNSTVWVKVGTVPTHDITLYLYYGNSSAVNGENGENTFELFDDFNDGSIDEEKWSITQGSGSVNESSGTLNITGQNSWNSNGIGSIATFDRSSQAYMIYWKMKINNANGDGAFGYSPSALNVGNGILHNFNTYEDWHRIRDNVTSSQLDSFTADTYHEVEIFMKSSTGYTLYKDVSSIEDDTTFADNNHSVAMQQYDTFTSRFDVVYVRKHAATAPSTSLGTEEVGPGPVAYWKFDEGHLVTAHDSTQNENHASTSTLVAIEQQINIVNQAYTTNSTTFIPQDNSLGLVYWDGSKYDGATVYFEAVIYDSGNHAEAALYTDSGEQIAIATTEGLWDYDTFRVRSSAISLTNGTKYTVRFRSSNSGRWQTLNAARLIIVQNDPYKIENTRTEIEVGNAEKQGSSSATQLTDKKIYNYDSSNFSPTPTASFSASLRGAPPTIEQQINIIDQEYTTDSQSFVPTDNSLGLVHWDEDKYSGTVSVYLDADVYLAGNIAYVGLYSEAGSEITSVQTSGNDFTSRRVRSGALTLTDDTNYTVRLKSSTAGKYQILRAARLVVIQTDSTKIGETSTHIEVGDEQSGFTNTSYSPLTDYKIYRYNQDQFSPYPETSPGDVEFHASVKIDDSGDTVYAQLFNCGYPCNPASGQQVAEVSHTGDEDWTLKMSTNIDSDSDWDTTNDDEYIVRVRCNDGNGGGCSGNITNASIVLNQSDTTSGINDVELIHGQINTLETDTDDAYTNQDRYNRFNPDLQHTEGGPSLRGGVFTYYYESTLKTSTASTTTAYAQLYSGSAIGGSEVTTTSDSYTRVRSGDISSSMPQYPQNSAPNLDTQLKNSEASGDTTSASSSWLVIQVSNLATSGVTAYADLYNIDDTTQVSGSEVSTTSGDWGLVTSGSITLTTNKKYVVRLRSSNNNVDIHLANAKLVLDQSDAEYGLEEIELTHQYVNTLATDADTGYTDQEFLNQYDPDHFSGGTFYYYFEATMKTSGGTGYAKLKDDSGSDEIDNPTTSELQTTSDSYEYKISSDLSGNTDWPSSVKNMDTIIKNSGSATTSVSSSRLLIHGDSIGSSVWPDWENEDMCVSGKCLSFNGTDDFAMVVNAESIDLNQQLEPGFTFQTWIRANSDGENHVGEIFDKGSSTYLRITNEGSDGLADLEASLDLVAFDATVTITDGITLNKWHHVAMTFTSDIDAEITVYIDGVKAALSSNGVGVATAEDNNLLIGGSGTANFHGFIDEFKIYPYERSASEIATDYQQASAAHGASAVLGARDYSSLSQGLVGYWKMDESSWNNNCSALTVTDSSGNNNHGKACPSSTGPDGGDSGKFGNGGDFDGSDDNITITDSVSLDMSGKDQFTISAWIKADSLPTPSTSVRILNKDDNALNNAYHLELGNFDASGTQLYVMARNTSNTAVQRESTTSESFSTDTWYHVVGVLPGAGSKLLTYINGVDKSSWDNGTFSGTLKNADWNLYIGTSCSGCGDEFDGIIDEVRIYNRALSPTEISDLYHWAPGPVAYFPFDEGIGTSTVFDKSGNGFSGTMNGSMTESDWVPGKFGSALNFDGTNDSVVVGDISSKLDLISTDPPSFTYSAWMKAEASCPDGAGLKLVYVGGSGEGRLFYRPTSCGGAPCFGFQLRSASTISYTKNNFVSPGNWYHVTGTYDQSTHTISIYLNGVLHDFDVAADYDLSGTGPMNMTVGYNQWYFKGGIDDVRLYNYVRTPEQIIQDMNAGHPAPGSPIGSPVGHWNFDEGYGTTANDSGTGGNNGTLENTAEWSSSGKFSKAVYFDGDETGNDTHVRLPDNAYNGYSTGTISLWFKQDDSGDNWQNMFGVEGSAVGFNNTLEFAYEQSTDRVHMYMLGCDGTNLQAYYVLPGSQTSWHHAAWTISETGNAMYIDGHRVELTYASGNSSNTCFIDDIDEDTTTFYTIGCLNDNSISGQCYTGELYEGLLDEVKVYNFALTADQIKLDYNKGASATFGNVADQSDEGFGGNAPIAWWKFDENTDNTCDATNDLCDTSGNDNHGAKTNMEEADWVPGKIGSALDFDGTNEYVALSSQVTLADNAAWTISYWYSHETTYTGGNYVMGDRDDFANSLLHTNSGVNYDMAVTFDDIDTINFDFPEDERFTWHHITVVCDGSDSNNVDFYYDGVYQQTGSQTDSEIHIEDIGDATGAGFGEWNGKLDDIKIYDYARSPAQIAYDYNRGAPVGHWKLDECEGTTAYDSSGNGNNGTINIWPSGGNDFAGTCEGSSNEAWYNGRIGKRGASIYLDGSSESVSMGTVDLLDFEAGENFSISSWFKTTVSTSWPPIIVKGAGSSEEEGYRLEISQTNQKVSFMICNGTTRYTSTADPDVTDGNWHHVAGVADAAGEVGTANTMYIYLDGVLHDSDSFPGGFDYSSPTISFSLSNGSFDGSIDEAKVYNYALTKEQVLRDMNQGAATRFGPSEGSP